MKYYPFIELFRHKRTFISKYIKRVNLEELFVLNYFILFLGGCRKGFSQQ
jgi:hypothetical protein